MKKESIKETRNNFIRTPKNSKKMKKKKQVKMQKETLLFILLSAIFVFVCLGIVFNSLKGNVSFASSNIGPKVYKASKIEEINLDEKIKEKKENTQREEITVEEADLEYITKYRNNNKLPKGKMQVVQEGRVGKQEIITKKIYQGEELVREEELGTKVTKGAVTKIVEIGTANYTSNYTPKVGDTLFVTSDRLAIQVEPDENATKINTINQGSSVQLVEIGNGWYKIKYQTYIGWAKADCLTYFEQNVKQEEKKEEKSKTNLTASLSKDMVLNKPSGLTLEQFKKILTGDSNDKNKIFEQNAEYFYYIEQQYNINGIFVAAVGIHESAWGTSKIAQDKKNLFGYGAYDNSAYTSAYTFTNYSESIDLIARVFTKYYINPAGTKIYDNQEASGKYYNGSTLEAVNKKYATDKNWNNSVYKWMSYLYNKL